MYRLFLIAALGLITSGCATMNSAECTTGDWYAIGFEDGAKGVAPDRVAAYRKACAKHGVTPDLKAYQEGRRVGLEEYCRPSNGYILGARGGHYNGVCPAATEPEFVDAYYAGRERFKMVEAVRSGERQVKAKKRELTKVRQELKDKEAVLISDGTTSGERAVLLDDTRFLASRIGELEAEILDLEREIAVAEDRLAEYEAAVVPEF